MLISRESVSAAAGAGSLAVWMTAQSPQIYQNYCRKSVSGLSPVFLIQWMLGDLTNAVGSILTDQTPFQIIIAIYMLFIDMLLVGQLWCAYLLTSVLDPRAC